MQLTHSAARMEENGIEAGPSPPAVEEQTDSADCTAFNEGRYEEAIASWEAGVKSCRYVMSKDVYAEGSDALKTVKARETQLLFNIALAAFKLGSYHKAIENCREVLERNPNHQKARYRLALSYEALDDFDRCIEECDAAESALTTVRQLRKRAVGKRKDYRVAEKEIAARMMKGISPEAEVPSWRASLRNALAAVAAACRCPRRRKGA
eukprot:Polyplicarium_translucidae@DN5221_c0_g1_i1.p1